jgi:hypothetical protein
MFGSGRAILSLRDNYRQDLQETAKESAVFASLCFFRCLGHLLKSVQF